MKKSIMALALLGSIQTLASQKMLVCKIDEMILPTYVLSAKIDGKSQVSKIEAMAKSNSDISIRAETKAVDNSHDTLVSLQVEIRNQPFSARSKNTFESQLSIETTGDGATSVSVDCIVDDGSENSVLRFLRFLPI